MRARLLLLPSAMCVAALSAATSLAQTPAPQVQEPPPPANSVEAVASEIALLRRSVQGLSARLREVGDKLAAPEAKPGAGANEKQHPIVTSLDILTRTEQRAEGLRRQLFEQTEKENSLRTRVMQLEEDLRPDSIERAVSLTGSTRTPDVREARRRVLEHERKGVETLLVQTTQNRMRLEEDVRQADTLVLRLRQRLLPAIEKEIDKIDPNSIPTEGGRP
ncbi:MAG TPA: hypothetical protein VK422_14900 [Pyrinomonadaceae bacterium]|nr:hypothetical protein [Pyrinomonadaceae bacterium]